MGCDIHMVVEARDRYGDGDYDREPWKLMITEEAAYGNREYEVFSLLAGVRNREHGTPGYISPIALPRGWPVDETPYTRELREKWGRDGHSHSWLLLSEARPLGIRPWGISSFDGWLKSLTSKATRLSYWQKEEIRLVFFFDN